VDVLPRRVLVPGRPRSLLLFLLYLLWQQLLSWLEID
jgi:hypothetical protein